MKVKLAYQMYGICASDGEVEAIREYANQYQRYLESGSK